MIKIATSILSSQDRMASVKKLNHTDTDYIHIDAMDGIFVPNYQLPVEEVNKLGRLSQKPFDIHLMLADPKPFIENLTIQNIDTIIIHLEIDNVDSLIALIKSHGYKVGLAIKPKTNINLLDKYLNIIDKVLIMSVEPGFGGQTFMESAIPKINLIRKKRNELLIEVDGGINNETINKLKNIADIAVVGSYIINQEDYHKTIIDLKK